MKLYESRHNIQIILYSLKNIGILRVQWFEIVSEKLTSHDYKLYYRLINSLLLTTTYKEPYCITFSNF